MVSLERMVSSFTSALGNQLIPTPLRKAQTRLSAMLRINSCGVHRTPLRLEATIDAVLQAYDAQKAQGGMMGEAAGLMTPQVIERMRRLLATLQKEFM